MTSDRKLVISDTLSLPIDFVKSTAAILGKKRKGKSYKAMVIAEEMLQAGQHIVAFDPTGAWWGLRSSADGTKPGYPVLIIGGQHGDLPLDPTSGEALAEAVVAERFSVIIDLSDLTKGEEQRFAAAFLERLYRKNKRPVHLFLDEADVYAPQRPFGFDESKTLGACQSIVRRGGIKGIGCTMITQRPAVLNKDVLSQIDTLILIGMHHKKDLDAIDDWVKAQGDPEIAAKLRKSMPTLPLGDAWVWSPAHSILERIAFRDKRTFDSSRSPEVGEQIEPPKVLAEIDIAKLGEKLAKSAQLAKENDPTVLRRRIAELEARIADRQMTGGVTVVEKPVEKIVTVQVLEERHVDMLVGAMFGFDKAATKVDNAIAGVRGAVDDLSKRLASLATTGERLIVGEPRPIPFANTKRELVTSPDANVTKVPDVIANDDHEEDPSLDAIVNEAYVGADADRRTMLAIVELTQAEIPVSVVSIAAWLGIHPRTKAFLASIGKLREVGFLDGLTITRKGEEAGWSARTFEVPSVSRQRVSLCAGLTEAQIKILDYLGVMTATSCPVSVSSLAVWLGVHPRTKDFLKNLGILRSRGYLLGLSLTEIGWRAVNRMTRRPGMDDVLAPLDDSQRTIVETVARWPEGALPSIATLANTLGLHPRTKALLQNVGILRSRGLLTSGWPIKLTEAMQHTRGAP